MNFYESISVYYDEIFPLTAGKLNFAKAELKPPAVILDIGCSTGTLAQALAADGHQVHGVDKDPTMIRLARCNHSHDKAHFATMDMMAIDHYFPENHFDRILCLGNTLVHLPDDQALLRFLRKVKALVKPGGDFRVQMIHYDLVMSRESLGLSTIETESLNFHRSYKRRVDGRIDFKTRLELKGQDNILDNTIPLIPLMKERLERLMKEAGFETIAFYGGFDRSPLTETSIPLVCIAK
jgi:SAM-dependent methyltransferase